MHLVSGFVFSIEDLTRLIDRERRLSEARALFQTGQNSKRPVKKAA